MEIDCENIPPQQYDIGDAIMYNTCLLCITIQCYIAQYGGWWSVN